MVEDNETFDIDTEDKRYIFGRSVEHSDALLSIGRFQALDSSLGSSVFMDVMYPHICLICGKRGYGKSYTMGVLLEEIAKQKQKIRKNLCAIVIDTLGIFWSLSYPNTREDSELQQWNLCPNGFSTTIFCLEHNKYNHITSDIKIKPLSLATANLSPVHWCQLFQIKPTDPAGMIISKAVLHLKKHRDNFRIDDIISVIQQDDTLDNISKGIVENLLLTAESWNLFKDQGFCIQELLNHNTINIIDLSLIENEYLKSIVTSIICDELFNIRVRARKETELADMGLIEVSEKIPLVWLAIDEAQVFLPADEDSHSKKILINKWMRQGRQPGVSLILATQKPSLLDPEVFSHADIIYCHRLTAEDDINSLQKIHPTYLHGNIEEFIKKIGKEKGVALVIDDTRESIHYVKIRPRQSWHGGQEPSTVTNNDTIEKLTS